ncbi:hypothetical protein MY3296_002494 [Beauveria thailandica]
MGVFKSSFFAILVLITSVSVSCSPVPSVNHAAVQKHKFARSAMIALEKSQRQDHAFRQNLSPTAKKADEIVRAIRQDEIDHFWRVHSVSGDDTTERFAGQMFPLARPYILETKLWRVVKRMPKGALLHAHLLAMLPYEVLLDTVFHTDGMTVSSSHNLATEESRREASILFSYSEATPLNSPTIESTDYVPRTPVSIQSVLMSFPGGEEAFLNFTNYDFYQVIQGFDNIGLAGLGALAHNSLRWSHFEDQTRADWILDIDLAENGSGTKARYIQEWNRQWEDFCSWIVDEFGEQYGR